MRTKKFISILLAVISVLCVFALGACKNRVPDELPSDDDPPSDVVDTPKYEKIEGDKYFLKADGATVKNADGNGIILRGINAGGLFVTEHWMTGFLYNKTPSNDYRSLTQNFIERFGEDQTVALWEEYRSNWWTEQDFINCADMGFNVIRLPFTYMNVDFAAVTSYDEAGKEYDFSALDAFVEKAAEYGMYTILDLHGAYGSQNGQDHSGQSMGNASEVDFYSNAEMKNLTVKLWGALAEHYKSNPAVAGYDILNEPGEKAGTTSRVHWQFYDEVYKAIRGVGDEHIVIMESCWDAENLPLASSYKWSNCMYSFHHYAGTDLSYEKYVSSWEQKISSIEQTHVNIPLQMGEFTNYSSIEQWDFALGLMDQSDWHWTAWTYKVWGNMPWGVINVRGVNDNKVDASKDSYDEIVQKFKLLNTDSETCQKYTFDDGTTLEQIYKNHCIDEKHAYVLDDGTFSVFNDDGWLSVRNISGLGKALCITDSFTSAVDIKVEKTDLSDGSVYLTATELLSVATVNAKSCVVPDPTAAGKRARFFVEKVDDEYKFISALTKAYLRVGDDGVVYADATEDQATVFYVSAL